MMPQPKYLQKSFLNLKSAWHSKRGASLTPYALIVGLISVLAIVSISNIGSAVKDLFIKTANTLDAAAIGQTQNGAETGESSSLIFNAVTLQNPTSSVTTANSLTFRLTFNEPVTNIDVLDFTITGTTTIIDSIVDAGGATDWDITITDATPLDDGIDGNLGGLNNVIIGVNLSGTQNITAVSGGTLPNIEPAIDETFTHITSFSPTIIGSVTSNAFLNLAFGIALKDTTAWVAAFNSDSLTSVDISDPANPTVLGTVTSVNLDGINGIAITGNVAWVTSFMAQSLTAVDISTPASPVILGTISHATLNGARDIVIIADTAWVTAENASSLTAIDISNPASPSISVTISHSDLNGARGLALSGSILWVAATDSDKVTAVDISNPAIPLIRGNVSSAIDLDDVIGIAISGTTAWVASFNSGSLTSINITDPLNPAIIGSIHSAADLDGAIDLAITGNTAWVVSNVSDSLTAIDISTPATPTILGSVTGTELDGAGGVAIVGDVAWASALTTDTVTAVDISP